jgi:hypothetical protein
MPNIFEGRWSCFIVKFDEREGEYHHELQPIGTMHLEFRANGDLERGHLVYEGHVIHLTGTSTRIGEPRISLETEFHDGFEGILTFESDDRNQFATTGKLHLVNDSDFRARLRDAGVLNEKAQDDPPWVITKP